MAFVRGQASLMNNDATSQSAMSELYPFQDLSTFTSPQGVPGGLTDVFSIMLKEMNDLFNKISACEAEFHQVSNQRNSKKSRANRGSSQHSRENNEYMEILNKKGKLLEELTATIDRMESSSDIPKSKIHCYQKYAALLKQRYEKTGEDINMLLEDGKKTRQEFERLEKQVETFKTLKNDERSTNEGDEIMQLFREAKTDLNTILSVLYPEDVKIEFNVAMGQLTEAFMKNENEDDQYVELSLQTLQNYGIRCLMKDHVIVEDPSDSTRYRLNMAE